MAAVKMPRLPDVGALGLVLLAGTVGLAVVGLYVWKKGGLAGAAAGVGAAAVEVAGGAASGAVGAVGATVGLPTPSETVTDPAVVRWIIDQHGYWTASKWAGAPALARAWSMDSGTGKQPQSGTAAYAALVKAPAGYGDPGRWNPDAGGGSVGWW